MSNRFVLGALASLIVAALPAAPAVAQQAPVSGRALTIYGDDPCPRDTICVRAPESDRYRIPTPLRRTENEATASDRAAAAIGPGGPEAVSGAGTCSTTGGTGQTGCLRQRVRQNREVLRQEAEQAPVLD